jgi:hypothetical protein
MMHGTTKGRKIQYSVVYNQNAIHHTTRCFSGNSIYVGFPLGASRETIETDHRYCN